MIQLFLSSIQKLRLILKCYIEDYHMKNNLFIEFNVYLLEFLSAMGKV